MKVVKHQTLSFLPMENLWRFNLPGLPIQPEWVMGCCCIIFKNKSFLDIVVVVSTDLVFISSQEILLGLFANFFQCVILSEASAKGSGNEGSPSNQRAPLCLVSRLLKGILRSRTFDPAATAQDDVLRKGASTKSDLRIVRLRWISFQIDVAEQVAFFSDDNLRNRQ